MNRRMMIFLGILALAAAVWMAAAEKPIVGTWQLTSDSPDGTQYRWTLVVKEQNGNLSGTLTGGPGQFTLIDPKMEGVTFTCKVTVEGQTYAIEGKISGAKLEGAWKGGGSQGFIKGTKES